MTEGLIPYDLAPPDPAKMPLVPRYSPLFGRRQPRPRYEPGPLAEDMARVVLDDDYYRGAGWSDFTSPQSVLSPRDVFDVPQEQRDRWQAAEDAYSAMQEEIAALMDSRYQT